MTKHEAPIRFEKPFTDYYDSELEQIALDMIETYGLFPETAEQSLRVAAQRIFNKSAQNQATNMRTRNVQGEVKTGAAYMLVPLDIAKSFNVAIPCNFRDAFERLGFDIPSIQKEKISFMQRLRRCFKADKATLFDSGSTGFILPNVGLEIIQDQALRQYGLHYDVPAGLPNIAHVLRFYINKSELKELLENPEKNIGMRRTSMFSLDYLMTSDGLNKFSELDDTFFPATPKRRFSPPYLSMLPDTPRKGTIAPSMKLLGMGKTGDYFELSFETGRSNIVRELDLDQSHSVCTLPQHKMHAIGTYWVYNDKEGFSVPHMRFAIPRETFGIVTSTIDGKRKEIQLMDRVEREANDLYSKIKVD